jgi:hypothetical protein
MGLGGERAQRNMLGGKNVRVAGQSEGGVGWDYNTLRQHVSWECVVAPAVGNHVQGRWGGARI